MINAVELFAGVGGFRVGLEKASKQFNVTFANQWEPATKSQPAFECYKQNFNADDNEVINEDIANIIGLIPEHDLLVGGFPCQDYSVARTLAGEMGIEGQKGVLFFEIMKVVNRTKPKFILLENVDRLLKSPSKQRGRDFSVMLASLQKQGYGVEWRVINAADYGFAQRRRRVFIFAYREDTNFCKEQQKFKYNDILHNKGFFAKEFPVQEKHNARHGDQDYDLPSNLFEVSDKFSAKYLNSGVVMNGKIYTAELLPIEMKPTTLGDILNQAKKFQGEVNEKYYLTNDKKNKKDRTEYQEMKYQKGAKREKRISKTGHEYYYTEGSMSFPDQLDLPSRTMLTSEGTKNRSSHVVKDLDTGRIRYLTPIECELLNGFEPGWTDTGMPERTRYFCMGNALVVGLIKKMGNQIVEIFKDENYEDETSHSTQQLALF
ncbi:DNA (cytosine-5-)-methyltransferase [Tenuibacillus multivorans]|uniref:Cytosine-specific methyltransferase n=1 Tax=Tenuibacillus multivorans TaxID=237069 RepID=A0A1G9WJE3_9BACI|nr:DNA (cytosine-5-)-methyltransferase [Tenuibacillus multivorans]GEL76488.1 cytosine-specific methyltransferase [Tenuibacillus multivorans]SDM84569.1 DNA (cytosine-5)-methyltransferase 1 [Tenuibacillus multivorans]